MVVAILSDEIEPVNKLFLVEADVRKAVFLKTVCRELGLKVEVFNNRIEELPPMSANIVSARSIITVFATGNDTVGAWNP